MKILASAFLAFLLFGSNAVFAAEVCDTYDEAIMDCAREGCSTTIDDFVACLIDEHGISEQAADGTNEVEELVNCFQTEYTCQIDGDKNQQMAYSKIRWSPFAKN